MHAYVAKCRPAMHSNHGVHSCFLSVNQPQCKWICVFRPAGKALLQSLGKMATSISCSDLKHQLRLPLIRYIAFCVTLSSIRPPYLRPLTHVFGPDACYFLLCCVVCSVDMTCLCLATGPVLAMLSYAKICRPVTCFCSARNLFQLD